MSLVPLWSYGIQTGCRVPTTHIMSFIGMCERSSKVQRAERNTRAVHNLPLYGSLSAHVSAEFLDSKQKKKTPLFYFLWNPLLRELWRHWCFMHIFRLRHNLRNTIKPQSRPHSRKALTIFNVAKNFRDSAVVLFAIFLVLFI